MSLPAVALTPTDLDRYSRQVILPEFGLAGQRSLAAAKVLVVGAGGLGSPVLLYLAAAGVGALGILDSDRVELSNLHRQVIHTTASVGSSKVASAAAAVAALNPGVAVVEYQLRLEAGNVAELIAGYDLVVDGADNFPTRYLVNDACVAAGIPLVWGSVLGFAAQVSVFWPAVAGGTQLRDLFPSPPAPGTVPSCAEAGVIGAVCGQVGAVMAAEAVKVLTGIGRPLLGRVLVIDALAGRWDELPLRASDTVPAPQPPVSQPARQAVIEVPLPAEVDPTAFLLDVRTAAEFDEERLPGSVNLPLPDLLAGELPVVAPGLPIVVVCRSGARAEVAAAALRARGLTTVSVLPGGLQHLRRS